MNGISGMDESSGMASRADGDGPSRLSGRLCAELAAAGGGLAAKAAACDW